MAQPRLFLISFLAMTLLGGDALSKSNETPTDTLIVKRNYLAAFQQLLSQSKGGNAKAMMKLSSAYRYGYGTAKNLGEAKRWVEAAANAGNAKAKLALRRWSIDVASTVKKQGAAAFASKIDFSKLPARPTGAVSWAVIAAAQKDHGAILALANKAPPSALLVAASLGDADTIKALPAGMAKDGAGRDPLMLAAASGKGEVLDALLAAKPDFATTDKAGQTAVSLAAASCDGATLSKLVTGGATLEQPVAALPIVVQRCADFRPMESVFEKRDLNATDAQGRSAAWFAAKSGNIAVLDWLAGHGADLSQADKQGFSPLHASASSAKAEAIALLLAKGTKPTKTPRAVSALMLAAASGCTSCIKALLDTKPALDEKDADGDTALMFAVRGLQGSSAQLLSDSGANSNAKNTAGDTPGKLAVRLGMAAAPK